LPETTQKDEDLLKRIREDYRYHLDYWRENREEAAKDMKYVSGDPWDEKDRQEREDNGRVCATPDELSQYLKQANNNLRQNKRAIKVSPKSEGASDQDASTRSDIIRGIEYKSNAQAAYTTAFEQCTSCGFGFARITTDYVDGNGFIQEPRIRRIPNQFTVLPDPDAKEADFSDQEKCFVIDTVRDTDFGRKYSKAKKTSFSSEDSNAAPDFIKGKTIIVCEAWYVEHTKRKKMQVKGAAGPTTVYDDEIKGEKPEVLNERTITDKKVVQYITNGIEILERNEWAGSWIPIAVMVGEEIYTQDGGQSKRQFLSLIRRARFPQKMLAYIASQELEEFGMAPRTPLMLWEGQELADEDNLTNLNKVPQAFIKLRAAQGPNGEMLPAPTRHPFVPNAAAYAEAREYWRRAVQAAIGVTPLPTAAQRQNEKSGIALEKIQNAEAVGSFHFTDNHDRFLENIGRQVNELITKVMDTPRHQAVRKADGSHGLVALAPGGQAPEGADPQQTFDPTKGEFDVTVSTGPSYQSQREEAANFADTLLQELQALAPLLPHGAAAQLLAMAVKLREIGPIGEQIVKIIEGDPENQQQQAAQAMAKLQQQTQAMQEMQQELQKLQFEKQAHVVDNQAKMEMKKMDHALEIAKLDNARAIAEIQTKAQERSERVAQIMEVEKELHGAAHESALSAQEHVQDLQAADQQHSQTLEQGDQAAQNQSALAQQAQEAAANQPAE
jgi:hypothetical protein